jgi:hypothetical protein
VQHTYAEIAQHGEISKVGSNPVRVAIQPFKTLVIREDRSNTPSCYVLKSPGHVVNKNGEVIRTAIKPGSRVRVYYVNMGDSCVVDHVFVLD